MPYWVFGQEFSKATVIFVINALQLELYRNIRILIFGTKCLICVFWRATLEIYCHFCNQHPVIGLTVKFDAETKILKFRIKNA